MPPNSPAKDDEKLLKQLSQFHYILAGLSVFVLCTTFAIQWWAIFSYRDQTGGLGSKKAAAEILLAMDGVALLLAICMTATGRALARRRNYKFIFAMACFECLSFPLGTALGVFTITTLSRESVKAVFNRGSSTPPPVPG